MKATIAAVAFAVLTQASPVPSTEELSPRLINIDLGLNLGGQTDQSKIPFEFTSTYSVKATPDQVVDSNNMFTGGLGGAAGIFNYGINSHENVICYNITITGFRGEYQSPARTATHIHEGIAARSGPPRIAFPNPVVVGAEHGPRNSIGCLRGPFKTGVITNGADTGDNFHVKQIEDNPCAFFTDVHSSEAVPGAVRGQLY